MRHTYPDLRLTVEMQIAEGDWVTTVVTARGKHQGVWMGMKPTHKTVEITAVNIDKVVDGRIVEHGGAASLLEPLALTYVTVVPDASITRGGCLLAYAHAELDARLETRLERVLGALRG